MMRKIYISMCAAFVATIIFGQTTGEQLSIRLVLQQVEINNKELQANTQQLSATILNIKAENNLPDPSVSYTHQYGNKDGLGIQGELIASQSFDFPTLYAQRDKLAKLKSTVLDYQQAALRQKILLIAEAICLDMVMLNQRHVMQQQQVNYLTTLSNVYTKRLEQGDANILEKNKIDLELLNVRTESRRTESELQRLQAELTALNGGTTIYFARTGYEALPELPPFEDLWGEKQGTDPELLALASEQSASRQRVSVNKQQWLPDLELGYRLNTATGGERYNGFLVGMSIPLFANRHQVKKAKAEVLSSDLKYEDTVANLQSDMAQSYQQALSLRQSLEEYNRLLSHTNTFPLLNKALDAGQISVIEYFVELSTLFTSMDNSLRVENDYRKAVAKLLKHRL